MFHVAVTQDVIEHARTAVGEGRFGRRGFADGSVSEQVTGLIGQTVVMDLFGLPRPNDSGQSDGGVDFVFEGMSIDVKTVGRNVPVRTDYVNNLQAAQIHFPTDAYIFCSLNRRSNVLTVCGWTTKIEFLENAAFYRAGTRRMRSNGTGFPLKADLYEILNDALLNPTSFEILVATLEMQAGLFAAWRERQASAGPGELAWAA